MFKYLQILGFAFLVLINLSYQLDSAQQNVIIGLNSNFDQSYNLMDVCSGNNGFITCDPTQSVITKLTTRTTSVVYSLNANFLSPLKNLTELTFGGMEFLSEFWETGVGQFKNLTTLSMATAGPNLIPSTVALPSSLTELRISIISFTLPEEIFHSNITALTVGNGNDHDVNIFPTLTSNSTLIELNTVSRGSFNLNGSKFPLLQKLTLGFYEKYNYNSYDTWPSLNTLEVVLVDGSIPMREFPSSLFNLEGIISLTIVGCSRFLPPTTSAYLDFTISKSLNTLVLSSLDLVNNLPSPVIKVYSQVDNIVSLSIDFELDPTNLDIFQFSQVTIKGFIPGTVLPIGDYSRLLSLNITNYNEAIDNSICGVRSYFSLYNSSITTIPNCFICDYGSSDPLANIFNSVPNLPANTYPTCPNFSITNQTQRTFPTLGGDMIINGINMGWRAWNEQGEKLSKLDLQVIKGDTQFKLKILPGTGSNKSKRLFFHEGLSTRAEALFSYSYEPPIITEFYPDTSSLTITGANFGSDSSVSSIKIAGKLATIQSDFYSESQIIAKSDSSILPYLTDLVVSVEVTVNHQSTLQVIRIPPNTQTLLNPLPNLYSEGGYAIFTGSFLSFDPEIQSMSVAGVQFEFIEGNSTSVIYRYGKISPGIQTFIFRLDTYEVNGDNITVLSNNPCVVKHGYCLGTLPVCYDPYFGPDCSSLPSNVTKPPLNTTYPIISTSTPYQMVFAGEVLNINYSVKPVSIKEITSTGDLVNDWSNSTYSISYPSPMIVQYSSMIPNYVTIPFWWYTQANDASYAGNAYIKTIPSSMRLQTSLSYSFAQTTNRMEIIYQVDLESQEQSSVCSYFEHKTLPTFDNFDYIKAKINYVDLFTRIDKICFFPNTQTNCSITTNIISQTPSKISYEIILLMDSFSSTAFDMDFTLVYDEVSSKQESNPICSQTIPNDKPCKGTPECNGNGICIDGKCTCTLDWKGEICDSKDTTIPTPTPNTTNPDIIVDDSDVQLHISILAIKELDFNGNEVKSQELSSWDFTKASTDSMDTYYYSTKLFTETLVNVKIDYFKQDSKVEFTGVSTLKLKGSIKYSANITLWPFEKSINQLEIIFSSTLKDNFDQKESCSYKNVEYIDENNDGIDDNVESVSIQINGKTFSTKFTNMAIVDGTIRVVKNVIIPTQEDTGTESNAMIGVITPHHSDYIIIDPDFNLLITYVSPDEKEGSICSSKGSNGLTKSQLAGIIVGCVGVFIVASIIIIFFLQKKLTVKLFVLKLKTKIIKM